MEVQEPMLQSHAKSLIPGNKVLMTLLLRLRLRPTMSSQIPKIELRQRLTVLNLISQIWKNIHTTAIIDICKDPLGSVPQLTEDLLGPTLQRSITQPSLN